MIDLGVLLRVPCVEVEMGFDISPDGERVAFSWNPERTVGDIYEISLHLVKFQTECWKHGPHLISRIRGENFSPRYSPDGHSLAYTVDFDGSEAVSSIRPGFCTRKSIAI